MKESLRDQLESIYFPPTPKPDKSKLNEADRKLFGFILYNTLDRYFETQSQQHDSEPTTPYMVYRGLDGDYFGHKVNKTSSPSGTHVRIRRMNNKGIGLCTIEATANLTKQQIVAFKEGYAVVIKARRFLANKWQIKFVTRLLHLIEEDWDNAPADNCKSYGKDIYYFTQKAQNI